VLKEDELVGACRMYVSEEKCIRGLVGNPKEETT